MAPSVVEPNKIPVTEIERQENAISQLGDDYEYPLFSGRHAVESQRKSGYKNTARAAREIIDNSFEAGASQVHVVFERPGEETSRKKHQRRDAITSIAFIDDGPGMLPKMARFALSWGGGTRFDNPNGIGRFGFGLPNASINQTRRVEVYTRTDPSQPWICAILDINYDKMGKEEFRTGLVTVDEPAEAELPEYVVEYLSSKSIDLSTGTIVNWVKPDRLTARSGASLRKLLMDDFGVVYRYLLPQFKLLVDGSRVDPLDPLFLTPHARFFLPPEEGGAIKTLDKRLFVKYFRDPDSGSQHLEPLSTPQEIEAAKADPAVEGVGKIEVTIARFPYGFAGERVVDDYGVNSAVPKDSDVYRRMQIRKKRRGVTYVRAGREIDYIDNMPRTESEKSDGLGNWPSQQAYSMNYGLQLSFDPILDEAFGIGNDKQTVNPIEDMWRVLVAAEIDKAIKNENHYQVRVRKEVKERANQKKRELESDSDPVPSIAAQAESLTGRKVSPSQSTNKERQQRRDKVLGDKKKEKPEVDDDTLAKEIEEEAAKRQFAIGFFESEGGVFLRPDLGNSLQRVALINTAHPFFKTVYTRLMDMDNPMARQAVDLLLIAMVKAELDANEETKIRLGNVREFEWSPFLKNAYTLLDEIEAPDQDDDEEAEENGGD